MINFLMFAAAILSQISGIQKVKYSLNRNTPPISCDIAMRGWCIASAPDKIRIVERISDRSWFLEGTIFDEGPLILLENNECNEFAMEKLSKTYRTFYNKKIKKYVFKTFIYDKKSKSLCLTAIYARNTSAPSSAYDKYIKYSIMIHSIYGDMRQLHDIK